MGDLGSIAANGNLTKGRPEQGPRSVLRSVVCANQHLIVAARDDSEGNPSAPSLRMDARGTFRFLWVVDAEAATLSVDVKQAANVSPRPRVTIKANPAIGVLADVTGSAASGTGWVTIGPLAVSPTSAGVLVVALENLYDAQVRGAPCYWDNIVQE